MVSQISISPPPEARRDSETHRKGKDLFPKHPLPPTPHVLLRRRVAELVYLLRDFFVQYFLVKWTHRERCEQLLSTFDWRGHRRFGEDSAEMPPYSFCRIHTPRIIVLDHVL